jgi:rhodanese-related sulfurtransferase
VTEPLVAAWRAHLADPSAEGEDGQWRALEEAERVQAGAGAAEVLPGEAVVDVRGRGEFATRPRPGALNAPLDELGRPQNLDGVVRWIAGRPVVVLCATGMRARQAVAMLQGRGVAARNGHEPLSCKPGDPSCDPKTSAAALVIAGASALGDKDPPLGHAERDRARQVGPVVAGVVALSDRDAGLGGSGDKDSPIGAAVDPGSLLGGILGSVAGQVGADVAPAASDVARQVIGAGAEALRQEIPPTVAAATQAAGPAAREVASGAGRAAGEAAGKAAGESAAVGASGGVGQAISDAVASAGSSLAVVGGGVVVAVAAVVYLFTRKGKRL